MCVPLEVGFSKVVPEPEGGTEGGKAHGGAINFQSQTTQVNGHNDTNFSRLHHQQTPPDPGLPMTTWLSGWHPGFPHAGWELPPALLIHVSLTSLKHNPRAAACWAELCGGHGAHPFLGLAWYWNTFWAQIYPCHKEERGWGLQAAKANCSGLPGPSSDEGGCVQGCALAVQGPAILTQHWAVVMAKAT